LYIPNGCLFLATPKAERHKPSDKTLTLGLILKQKKKSYERFYQFCENSPNNNGRGHKTPYSKNSVLKDSLKSKTPAVTAGVFLKKALCQFFRASS